MTLSFGIYVGIVSGNVNTSALCPKIHYDNNCDGPPFYIHMCVVVFASCRCLCIVGCGEHPLIGPRHKCNTCVNFDLCSYCRKHVVHDPTHSFTTIE